ncbi:MAG: hypothetical protein LBJ00_01500 [Planctomycetaceae bacterium]|nr:hypothetical protein [Planctomycetaceae bacterium]
MKRLFKGEAYRLRYNDFYSRRRLRYEISLQKIRFESKYDFNDFFTRRRFGVVFCPSGSNSRRSVFDKIRRKNRRRNSK